MTFYAIPREFPRQSGAVLIISLFLLVVITLIGVTAMQTTTLDTKIAGNYKNYKISFEGAESALTEAQSRLGIPLELEAEGFSRPRGGDENQENNPKIWNLNPAQPDGCKLDQSSTNKDPWWFQWNLDCWKGNAISYSDKTVIKPLYLIEYQGRKGKPLNWGSYEDPQAVIDFYRITARGNTDQNVGSDVLLQSIFAWQYREN